MAEILDNQETVAQATDIPEGEAIAEGSSPEITEDNLFELVDSGEITLEEANNFLNEDTSEGEESPSAGKADSSLEGESLGEISEEESVEEMSGDAAGAQEPYRVFQTEEDFQRVFDNAWNKRYGKMMHEHDAERGQYQDVLNELGSLLGVPPEHAAKELKNRRRRLEAEKNGVDPEEYIARAQAEDERDYYKNQYETQQKQASAKEAVAKIRAQGAEISAIDPTFQIDEAMNNPEFAKIVFALSPVQPDKAVAVAYQTVYGKGKPAVAPASRTVPSVPTRPREGGLSGMRQEKRPVDYGRMSDRDILSIADRVMRGEKVDM